MNDIKYLLSIKELLEGPSKERLLNAAYAKLDQERLWKAKGITNERKQAECIGAGLLLQLGLQQIYNRRVGDDIRRDVPEVSDSSVQLLTVSQVLEMLGTPMEAEYSYSENGKPGFLNLPLYFNLSHSVDYVFCVLSKQEVGVDIQYRKPLSGDQVLRRFFTQKEQELWDAFVTQEEKEHYFYKLWTRKEAFGKLTGKGIAKTVSVNVTNPETTEELGVFWEDYELLAGYQIAVCKWIGEKE